jgi:hypothetical protein
MEEQAERPELRSDEMSGFAPEDGPGPERDADDVAAGMRDDPPGMRDDPVGMRDDPPGAWDGPADTWDDPPGASEAAGWPEEERPATGEPRVDAALARLDELAARPVTEHRAVFEDVHRRLRDVLGELDTREQSSGDQPAAAGAERRAGR